MWLDFCFTRISGMEAQQEPGWQSWGWGQKGSWGCAGQGGWGKIRTWLRAIVKGGRRNTDGAICEGSGN